MDINTLQELAQTLRQLAYELPATTAFYVHKLADILENTGGADNDNYYWD